MAFHPWHSLAEEPPILVPEIGLSLRVRLPPEMSGGVLTVIDTENAPGHGPPLHRHGETEVFRVLQGRYLFEVDGRRFEAGAGDVVCIPGGAAHAFLNLTDAPARQTIQILPGMDALGFFTGMGALMRGGIPARDVLNSFGARWGVEFLGPPLRR
ncbi:cupin domain-containing protein [Roseomonas populi]|uniref:Cupin domain-containing protein n=1 Tax=Roseomonas populi TaxID=3121582 RepID=A0ABT1X8R3_9PROT|nr:cupin domain-containing protein [Roseomonas pecuniae]MCR0984503.1 cupin domain-containing protein [Roseomonas pecuniae]